MQKRGIDRESRQMLEKIRMCVRVFERGEASMEEMERLKELLFSWGGALDQCRRKQEEMKRLGSLRLVQRQMWLESGSEGTREILEEIDQRYNDALRRIQEEVREILEKKAAVDGLLAGLGEEERQFLRLRFEEGQGFDYIAYKMHISRATAFRMQRKILQKLKKVETP